MKWLITGGCGFLGSNLADELLINNHDLVIFDNLSRKGSEENLEWLRQKHGANWHFANSDIRDSAAVNNLVNQEKPDVIAHLAGQVAMTTSLQNPRLDFETNALGSFNILEAVRVHTPQTIILYSSTNKVYGDLEWVRYEEHVTRYVSPDFPDGFDEKISLNFHSPYGCSKGAADQYMQDYARMYDLRTVVFRHSSMYGGRQFATYDQGWIGWFCIQALKTKQGELSKPFTISGNGKQVRDVLHADDIKRLYQQAVENIDQASGQVFNIGGGMNHSLSLLELFTLLEKYLNIELVYQQLAPRQSDQKIFVADIAKAKKMLGWQPNISAAIGISKTLNWLASLNLSTI